jgi:predicted Zn-dependent peptidase
VVQVEATALSGDTVPVVKSITRELERLAHEAPSAAEVEHAARSLTRGFLNDTNPMKSLSEMLAEQPRLGLGPEDYDSFHRAVLELDPANVRRIVEPYFDLDQAVVVVSADAKSVAAPLAQLAPVVVIDPERDFAIKQRLPYSPIQRP